ncbi:MAG: F420-dependent oxidoreductase [Acidimicrobiales bacterium]|nr:F420-dependent oxidoreductase [Acidimicrobiales bacterium]
MSIVPEGQLVYGMQLPIQTVSRSFAEPWESSTDVEGLIAIIRHADATSFFYVAACDHVGIPAGAAAEQMGTAWYDPVAVLGMAAALTTNVRLLSSVYIVALRHPLHTAKAFMTLDRLSAGRAILGVGAGHLQEEFDVLGVPFADRGAVTDDAIDCIRAVLADEFPRHPGPRFATGDLGVGPRPVQERLPIWVGGRGRAALRRVAARGDGWIPQGSERAAMPEAIGFIRAELERLERDVSVDIGFVTEAIHVGHPTWDLGDRPTLSGPAEQIAESMRDMSALGVNHLQVRFRSRCLAEQLEQMSAWHEQVAPLLPS